MRKSSSLLACLFCCLWGASAHALDLTADLAADATWKLADSPVRLAQDVAVLGGVTLIIEPGVTVELKAGVSLVVRGQLIARGQSDKPIVFTGAGTGETKARWKSLVFKEGSVDATFEKVDDYVNGSILEYCRFDHATKALTLLSASPYVYRTTFSDNQTTLQIETPGGAAIYMEGGSNPRIRECTFERNVAAGFAYGGAIYVESSDPIIQDNEFTDNTAIYGGALCTTLMASPIVGNLFTGNSAKGSTVSEGGAASLVSTIAAFLNNTLTGNSSMNDGGGLHVCVDCHPHATPFVMDNTIVDNVMENADPAHGVAGVGAAFLRMFVDNNVHGNLRAGEPADFGWYHPLAEGFPEWVSNVLVGQNWWGTTDRAAIEATITDGTDIPEVGVVDIGTPLTAAVEGPTPRVTITTRRLRYEDAGEPMPLFLTLYNPGAEGEFELRILVQYDQGPALPLAVPLSYPGATQKLGAWRLVMPENSVYFTTLVEPVYEPESQPYGSAQFHAALYDSKTGKLVGRVCTIRTDFVNEVLP